MDSTGRTAFDFIYEVLKHSLIYILFIGLVVLVVYMLCNPQKVREWNSIITEHQAKYQPKKRKKSFERKINLTVDTALLSFKTEFPNFTSDLMPYELKIEWISGGQIVQPILDGRQAIIYVNDYKDEAKQAVIVISSYVKSCFAEKAKHYLDDNNRDSVDILVTKKIIQNGRPYIYDYFLKNYFPGLFLHSENLARTYDKLKTIDDQGLFLPILINELEKFARKIYPSDITDEIEILLKSFLNLFIT